ncbi:MAG: hypothetical protein FWB91_06795 [Defluviitaleaceae bacterium]|nr:hypothetical protein [Defluviitaleaceae bacterium]
MKVKYLGDSFGVDGLTDGREYECLGVEGTFLRVIDDSGEDYLYPVDNPASLNGCNGRWEIVADSGVCTLQGILQRYSIAV